MVEVIPLRSVFISTLSVIALLACSTETALPTNVNEDAAISMDTSETAPPKDTTLVLVESDNRENFVLGVGDSFRTRLESVPTAGYAWFVTHLPDGLEMDEDFGMEPTNPEVQMQPGFTGGNHYVVHSFKALKPGDYDLVMIEGRQWELFDDSGELKPDWKSRVEGRFQVRLVVRD